MSGIEKVEIEQLFGHLNYIINAPASTDIDSSRVLILYGDNGSGKTTILRAIFLLLSQAPNKGHRGRLGEIAFKRIAVRFYDGREVSATREAATTGPFTFAVSDPSGARHSGLWTKRSNQSLTYREEMGYFVESHEESHESAMGQNVTATNDKSVREFDATVLHLRAVVPETIYFLRDDRTIESDVLPDIDEDQEWQRRHTTLNRRVETDKRTIALENALRRAQQWVSESTLRASTIGGQNTDRVYVDVARRIASPSQLDDPAVVISPSEMKQRLLALGRQSESYSELGLLPHPPSPDLVAALEGVPADRMQAMMSVLVPFADGLTVRLEALEGLRFALTTYLEQTRAFLRNKHVEFSVRHGLTVVSDGSGEPLSPDQLSSGERQLLLLLTTTLYTRDTPALYIIDEPELSLNMKWQRRLVDSLLACTAGANASFVMASHSFELMAAARERVVALTAD